MLHRARSHRRVHRRADGTPPQPSRALSPCAHPAFRHLVWCLRQQRLSAPLCPLCRAIPSAHTCGPPVGSSLWKLEKFDLLKERVLSTTKNLMLSCLEGTKQLVATMIEMELVRISTDHPDFQMKKSAVGMLIATNSNEQVRTAPADESPGPGHILPQHARWTMPCARSSL